MKTATSSLLVSWEIILLYRVSLFETQTLNNPNDFTPTLLDSDLGCLLTNSLRMYWVIQNDCG
jgi:hypothetical protein